MNTESDEQMATVFRELMRSYIRDGSPAEVAQHDRYLTYLADFLTLEEIQEKEKGYRVHKTQTKFNLSVWFRMANDPVRQEGYKRHCETCAALRSAALRNLLPPPLTDAELEALFATTDKHKPKGKPKKKKNKKGAAAQLPDVEVEPEAPSDVKVEPEAGSVVTRGGAEAEEDSVVTHEAEEDSVVTHEAEEDSVVTHAAEEDSVVTHAAEAKPLNQKYSPIKTSSGDVWNGHDISRYKRNPTLLFSLHSNDIKIDGEGWFSVTPEEIAKSQAKICEGHVVIDAFSGWGGNSIHFANDCPHVIAIDIEKKNIEMAKHNAGVYKVAHKIEFILGDFFALAKTLKGDIVFLSPPWGGPAYPRNYKLDMLKPKSGKELFEAALSISTNIIMYLPKGTDEREVMELANLSATPLDVVIVKSKAEGIWRAITVYYSKSVDVEGEVEGEVEVRSYFRDKINLLDKAKAKYRPPPMMRVGMSEKTEQKGW